MKVRAKEDILGEINAGLPPVDWKKGALDYIQHHFSTAPAAHIEEFAFTKPLGVVTPEDPEGSLTSAVYYLHNFTNAIQLLKLKYGDRVLDVACGAGWLSHWLRKLGYRAYGVDISPDLIDLARRRLLSDPHLRLQIAEVEDALVVLDLETNPLPPKLKSFDAAILESCLHHFFDPISALKHVVEGIKTDGLVLILEGENRKGPLRPEFTRVMDETHTLERPYTRRQLIEILEHAGLKHYEFLSSINGFIAESDPAARSLYRRLNHHRNAANLVVASTSDAGLRRVVPTYIAHVSKWVRVADVVNRYIPSILRPVARRVWHKIQ